MREIVNGINKSNRKSRIPLGFAGRDLVFDELRKRGFDAQLGPREQEMLVRVGDAPPTPIRIKTAHVTPWYVRWTSFVGRLADQVTVFVLIGLDGNPKSARFFVAMNRELVAYFRPTANGQGIRKQPSRKTFGYIDSKSVEKYEDNWIILK